MVAPLGAYLWLLWVQWLLGRLTWVNEKTDNQSFSMCFCVSIRMISSEIWNNLARVIFLKANEIARGDCNF